MLIRIMHYYISTDTTGSRNNHSEFYPVVATLIGRTGIIEDLASTLELPLLITSVVFFHFICTNSLFVSST